METNKENMESQPAPDASSSEGAGATVDVEDAVVDLDTSEPDATTGEASEADIETPTVTFLQAELEVQRQKAEEHLNHLQRLQAEFNNYRRRMAQEKLQAAGRGKEELLLSLLPVLNNLRLALQHAEQDPEAVRQGVQMIWHQCEDFLRSQGVEAVATVGHPFDPMLHEALSTAPATDEAPPNTVVAEINAGYMLNGQLLRAAQVVVAQASEPDVASADPSEAGEGADVEVSSEASTSTADNPSI